MTETQALAALTALCDRVQTKIDNRPNGFVAVAIRRAGSPIPRRSGATRYHGRYSHQAMSDSMQASPDVLKALVQKDVDALMQKIAAEHDAIVNLLMVLVRRSGGQTFVTKAELDALENCVLTSRVATIGPEGVQVSVRRDAPPKVAS